MRLLRKPAFLGLVWLALVGATPGRSAEMTFSTVPYGQGCAPRCQRMITATGQITGATPQAFLDFADQEIERPGLLNVMLLHSTGGSVAASLKLGRILRKLGAVVIVARPTDSAARRRVRKGQPANLVSGTCASACVYLLAGGHQRIVPPESRVAVHRMAGDVSSFDWSRLTMAQKRIYAGEAELSALSEYLAEMGVSGDLVAMAEEVPHENARLLSTHEMMRLRLAQPKF